MSSKSRPLTSWFWVSVSFWGVSSCNYCFINDFINFTWQICVTPWGSEQSSEQASPLHLHLNRLLKWGNPARGRARLSPVQSGVPFPSCIIWVIKYSRVLSWVSCSTVQVCKRRAAYRTTGSTHSAASGCLDLRHSALAAALQVEVCYFDCSRFNTTRCNVLSAARTSQMFCRVNSRAAATLCVMLSHSAGPQSRPGAGSGGLRAAGSQSRGLLSLPLHLAPPPVWYFSTFNFRYIKYLLEYSSSVWPSLLTKSHFNTATLSRPVTEAWTKVLFTCSVSLS